MSSWQPQLEELASRRYGALVGLGRLLVGSQADAEDLVQDAMVATFSSGARFGSVEEAERYVRRAVVTKSVDHHRRGGRDRALTARMPPVGEAADSSELLAGPALAALEQLGVRHRACVVLRVLEDLSVAETARVLGLAEGTVKRYLHEGLAVLRARLGTPVTAWDTDQQNVEGMA